MPVMIRILLENYGNANGIDNSIITRQLDIENGVEILRDMIKKIRGNIKTLDKQASDILEEKIKELDEKNRIRKEQIENRMKPNDSIDKRHLTLTLLREDHNRYKHELKTIENICYKKGWFD